MEKGTWVPFFVPLDSALHAVGGAGHDLGQQAHAELHRCREAQAAGVQRVAGVLLFIDTHLLKNRPELLFRCIYDQSSA